LQAPTLEPSAMAVADAQAKRTAVSEPAASVETSGQAAPEPPSLAGAAGTTADVGQPRREPVQAAAGAPPDPADAPWLRFAFLAFGGLLALGSAIRLFV
jgi:hypothetical protein